MCTGVEIALVASSVLAAGGAVVQGQQQQKMANYQAAQAEADADAAKAAAKVQAEKIRKAGQHQAAQANAAGCLRGRNRGGHCVTHYLWHYRRCGRGCLHHDSKRHEHQRTLQGAGAS